MIAMMMRKKKKKNLWANMPAFIQTTVTVIWMIWMISHYHQTAQVVVTEEELQIQMMIKKMTMNFPGKGNTI